MECELFLQDVYNITGIGAVIVGRVSNGMLQVGMKLNASGRIMEVKSIEMHHDSLQRAEPGQNVGIALSNADVNMLKSLKNTTITFSDSPGGGPNNYVPPARTEKKGFLARLFGG